jgi:peptidyl-prolyl cis-trans isomerase SurA
MSNALPNHRRVTHFVVGLSLAALACPARVWAQAETPPKPAAAAAAAPAAAAAGAAPATAATPAAPPAPTAAPAATRPAEASGLLADRIVAVVNDEIITRNELRTRVSEVKRALAQQGTALPPPDVLDRQVLERMIDERAELQEAKDTGIRVEDAMVDRAIGRMAEQNNMPLAAFRQRVERDGTPYAVFRDEIRDQIAMSRLRDREVDSTVQVSEGEIDNFLAEQTGGDVNAQELHLAEILVRVPEQATADQIEAARKKADDVYGQAQGGGDFAKLAVSYSDAPDNLTGGDMGWRLQERYPQLFLDAVTDLSAGQVAKPVKSPNGFHILKLVGRRKAVIGKTPFAAVTQTHVRHILLRVNEVMSANQARARLADIRERIVAGKATFEEMAKSYSADGSASRGGDLGQIYPGDTVPEFERTMNALKPGEISEPTETPFGMHLIQVIDRKSEPLPDERLRQMARQALRERKADEAFQDWSRSIRDRAYVEMRLDDR